MYHRLASKQLASVGLWKPPLASGSETKQVLHLRFLICVCNCTFCSMCGPGLALRGPDGSMHEAVEGMQAERAETFLFFAYGIVCIHLALCAAVWATCKWYNATVMSESVRMDGRVKVAYEVDNSWAVYRDHRSDARPEQVIQTGITRGWRPQ